MLGLVMVTLALLAEPTEQARLLPGMPPDAPKQFAVEDARHADLGSHYGWTTICLVVGRRQGEAAWSVIARNDQGLAYYGMTARPGASVDVMVPDTLPARKAKLTIEQIEPVVRFS